MVDIALGLYRSSSPTYRHDELRIEIVEQGRPWSFDGDGALFRLVSEALRIRLAHLFDPVLAVHTSVVEPLPHQITAVYESMLPRQQALDQLGMRLGERYGHDKCVINPSADTTATQCVYASELGVYCFRCASHGQQFRPGLKPGFVPYDAIIGGAPTVLGRLAAYRVHWVHARHDLQHHHPNISPGLLKEAYHKALITEYTNTDPRTQKVFNPNLDFVRGQGLWLSAKTLQPTMVDNDAADGLPYCQYVTTTSNGPEIKVDHVRRSQVKHREPTGYNPLRPYRGIIFAQEDGSIPILAEPRPKHPIQLLSNPMPEDQAFSAVESSFPLIHQPYFYSCIAAPICPEVGGGQPPMLCASGPSGSGKGETIRLAASFFGEDAVKVQLCDDPESFMRNLGMLLAAGHRFLVFDEFGKTPGLAKKLGLVLQLGSVVSWRPLYQNRRVLTPCRAAFFFPCVRFPDFLCGSAEFVRRTRHIRLHRQVPNWRETSGGDTTEWRDRSPENAHAANSILTHIWRLCHEYDFRFM